MTELNKGNQGELSEKKLSRRDWILLPLLSGFTVCLILFALALTAQRLFPNPVQPGRTTLANCLVIDDPSTGVRGIPNCKGWAGVFESGPAEYMLNSCGHRAAMECGLKPSGTYRIVLLGTSTALGWSLPREKTFAALLPGDIEELTGRKVDLYNEAMMWQSPFDILLSFKDVMAAKPDMILWVMPPVLPLSAGERVPPHDDLPHATTTGQEGVLPKVLSTAQDAVATGSVVEGLHHLLGELQSSQIQFMLQHFLYESQTQFVTSYLKGDEAAFLRSEPTPQWQQALPTFDSYFEKVAAQAKAAGVPLVVVMAPYRAQVAMVAMGEWPDGYDPYRLDKELRTIVTKHGATYLDILPDYQNIPNPERGYFPIDGHPTAKGHAVLARLLAKEMTSGAIPALKAAPSQASLEQGR
jgi:hypothetical protein